MRLGSAPVGLVVTVVKVVPLDIFVRVVVVVRRTASELGRAVGMIIVVGVLPL